MDRDHVARIRERAYQLWEEEGQPEGRDEQHWAQASAEFAEAAETASEVSGQSDSAPKSPEPSKPAGARSAASKAVQAKKPVADKAPATRSRGAAATRTPRKSS